MYVLVSIAPAPLLKREGGGKCYILIMFGEISPPPPPPPSLGEARGIRYMKPGV